MEGDVGNLTKVQSQFILFLNSLQGDITDVSNSISRIVKQLNKIEKDNKELMIELQSLSDSLVQEQFKHTKTLILSTIISFMRISCSF